MSFEKLVEGELRSIRMTKEQKRVVSDLTSLDWEIQEGVEIGKNPIVTKQNSDVKFEVLSDGKLQEIAQ